MECSQKKKRIQKKAREESGVWMWDNCGNTKSPAHQSSIHRAVCQQREGKEKTGMFSVSVNL